MGYLTLTVDEFVQREIIKELIQRKHQLEIMLSKTDEMKSEIKKVDQLLHDIITSERYNIIDIMKECGYIHTKK